LSLGAKIRKNALWLFAGGLLSRGLIFFSGIVLARLLVPEDFGLLVTTQIFTGLVAVIAGGGMGQALIRADKVTPNHFNVVFTVQLFIGLLILFIFWLIAPYIAVFFENELYEKIIVVSALTFVIRPFNNISSAKLSRDYNFKIISFISFFNVFISSALSIYMAYKGYGVWSLIVSGLITSVLMVPINIWLAKWLPKFRFDSGVIKELGVYGLKVTISHILYNFIVQIPNSFISKVHGAESLGLFNKALSLSQLPLDIVAGPVTQTVFRGMAEFKHDPDLSKYLYFKTLSLLCVYLFPFFTTMLWLSEPFVVIVYGEDWRIAGQLMMIVALTGFFSTLMRPATIMNDSHDKLKEEIRLDIEFILILIVLLYIVAPYGVFYVAWALVAMGAYQTIRVTRLAYTCIKGATLKDFIMAIYPALLLNFFLVLILLLLDFIIDINNIKSVIELLSLMIVLPFF